MGKKSGPPPPDYTAAAQQTAASNLAATQQQTWANRPTQTDPWGTVSWTPTVATDPSTGKPVTQWTQNTTLDPKLQEALNSQINVQLARSQQAEQMIPQMQQQFGQPIDFSGLSGWGQTAQAGNLQALTNPYGMGPQQQPVQMGLNFGGVQQVQGSNPNRSAAENAMYSSLTSRLDPQWAQQQQDLQTQMANQGISTNSAAYGKAMDQFNRAKTDAYQQANLAAINQGGQYAQQNQAMDIAAANQQAGLISQAGQFANQAAAQQFGQQLQAGQYGLGQQAQAFGQQQAAGAQNFNQQMAQANYQNALRQQQLQSMIQERGFSLNEMQALLNGQQVNMPQFSSFSQAGNAGGTDYSGAAAQQFNAAQQQQTASNQAMGQAIGGAASIAMMFSDAACKQLIMPLARHARGFHLWLFRYIGETLPRIGVVAQEVQAHAPDLVRMHRNGLLMVDYSRV